MTYRDEGPSLAVQIATVRARIAHVDARVARLRAKEKRSLRGAPPLWLSCLILFAGVVVSTLVFLRLLVAMIHG